MKRKILLVILILMLVSSGCVDKKAYTPPSNEKKVIHKKITVAGLKGPTSMGMIQMIDSNSLNSEKYSVDYIIENSPDSLLGKIINNEVQIAAVPTNMASILYNKTKGQIQFLALNTLGVLDIVGTENISEISDLENKTIALSGKGATPEFVLIYLLQKNNIAEKVNLEYYPDHASLSQAVLSGKVSIALLPQPFVTQITSKSDKINLLIDLNVPWLELKESGGLLPMGCLIINSDFAENNPEFVSEFLDKYKTSVDWVNSNVDAAGILIAKHDILPDAALASMAIPDSNIVYYNSEDSKEIINNFLKILYDFDQASIGGNLPDENFYYKSKDK